MAEKILPFTKTELEEIITHYPTPFHIYDEQAIRNNVRKLLTAFSWAPGFKEYFAVKATPNPHILKILQEEGVGADCSSLPELILSKQSGITGENIIFSSNDTPAAEYQAAKDLGAIINLDDISHIEYLEKHVGLPELISFRYNPGPLLEGGNDIIGYPEEAKYGLTRKQIFEAYKMIQSKGVKRFALHTMVISNELNPDSFVATAAMMFDLVVEVYQKLGIRIEMIDLGGGIGIPYRPEQQAVDLDAVSQGVRKVYEDKIVANGLHPLKITMECGRMITGPYGYLVSTVLHKKEIYKNYVGLDACMANLMRPALYGSYHHITVAGKENLSLDHVYDVTGSLCENNDKFAIDRNLPRTDIGDIVVLHDAGAHGHAMGFNYNGKLRSAELLLTAEGAVKMIRRAETIEDYFTTLDFEKCEMNLAAATKK
ncbi:diaminopimelate decarboxylase family protein [Pelosinus propionicus]|uniref:Diaminopimelate decarboxylase n=1 Tax=Pelosinus propionicus DSM 13327 TaxID=1123291 RepID=A0A1I4IJH7_9FIRM|nr:diaminopimelate decarboxylase [Pelosinus propionicus]SFL54153.1 diaminopimelate decarboxylase [Pelosinus propionicus DSM 13327]